MLLMLLKYMHDYNDDDNCSDDICMKSQPMAAVSRRSVLAKAALRS